LNKNIYHDIKRPSLQNLNKKQKEKKRKEKKRKNPAVIPSLSTVAFVPLKSYCPEH
jgi:hypothetical protein